MVDGRLSSHHSRARLSQSAQTIFNLLYSSVGHVCAATERILDRLIRHPGHELGCLMSRNVRSAALGGAVAAAAYVSHGTNQVCGPVGKRLAHLRSCACTPMYSAQSPARLRPPREPPGITR
jgi:hypothetical protein